MNWQSWIRRDGLGEFLQVDSVTILGWIIFDAGLERLKIDPVSIW